MKRAGVRVTADLKVEGVLESWEAGRGKKREVVLGGDGVTVRLVLPERFNPRQNWELTLRESEE